MISTILKLFFNYHISCYVLTFHRIKADSTTSKYCSEIEDFAALGEMWEFQIE